MPTHTKAERRKNKVPLIKAPKGPHKVRVKKKTSRTKKKK